MHYDTRFALAEDVQIRVSIADPHLPCLRLGCERVTNPHSVFFADFNHRTDYKVACDIGALLADCTDRYSGSTVTKALLELVAVAITRELQSWWQAGKLIQSPAPRSLTYNYRDSGFPAYASGTAMLDSGRRSYHKPKPVAVIPQSREFPPCPTCGGEVRELFGAKTYCVRGCF